MYHCPQCNAPIIPGSPYCTNCNFNFAATQYPANHTTESKREKRYRILLIVLATFFIFDSIFWRVLRQLSDSFGYEVYDYVDPYRWLTTMVYASVPLVIGLLLPKNRPWRLILVISGSLWLAFRLYEFIKEEFFTNYIFERF